MLRLWTVADEDLFRQHQCGLNAARLVIRLVNRANTSAASLGVPVQGRRLIAESGSFIGLAGLRTDLIVRASLGRQIRCD